MEAYLLMKRLYSYCSIKECEREPVITWTWTTSDMPLELEFPVCEFHREVVEGSELLDKAFGEES